MNGELLILFVILLLGLILCSFLGVKEGMENATVYNGPNGATAVIQVDSNGNDTLVVTASDGIATTYTYTDTDVYTAPNGATATIKQTSNGSTALQIKDSNGNVILTLTKNANTDNSSVSTQNGRAVSNNNNSNNNNYDNYNHYDGTSSPTIYYGPNGGTAKVIQTENENTIVITNQNGSTETYTIDTGSTDPNVSVYYGPNGGSAKMITDGNGNKAIEITGPNGSKLVYTGDNAYTYNSQDDTINQYDVNNNSVGADVNASSYYGPLGGEVTTVNGPRGGEVTTVSGPRGGEVTTVSGPAGNTYSTYDSSAYYNSLPQGVTKSQIPAGEEDLYILKSTIIPPICPRCPDVIQQSLDKFDVTKCPACPPCSRCPEPAFDCKKVPNYSSFNQDYMPVPVLSDFSGFGM